jgi:flap endonuclease-1
MGIKSLTQTIKKFTPDSIENENLYKLSGKKVAVDASLVIYQQLLKCPKNALFKTSKGKITNHITGLFYKIMNYISLNIEMIFVFDGKPPDNKQACIAKRKEKSNKAKEECDTETNIDKKNIKEKESIRITKEIIDDTKKLLNLMGIKYVHPSEGEGEAYASELCRIGYVDYVLTEDMDTMAYACPKLIRNCVDRTLKRKDIISIFSYDKIIEGLDMTHDKFLDFCILCGCDYCPVVPKIGNITALKLIRKYDSIEDIMENTSFDFPENYLNMFNDSKKNFYIFRDKLSVDDIDFVSSDVDIDGLKEFLISEVEMNEKRVENTIKKFTNTYNK